MTEKQIERVRIKIVRVKKSLAADKKQWGGYYHDGSGIRYMCPELYLKIRDFKGALNYFRWFAKHFPDDICYGEFYVEWAITLFKMGRMEEAGLKVVEGYDCDSVQVLNYSVADADWSDFGVWLEGYLVSH